MTVAREIFPQFDIQSHEINGKVAYYSALEKGVCQRHGIAKRIEDQGLTNLCKRIVETLTKQKNDYVNCN